MSSSSSNMSGSSMDEVLDTVREKEVVVPIKVPFENVEGAANVDFTADKADNVAAHDHHLQKFHEESGTPSSTASTLGSEFSFQQRLEGQGLESVKFEKEKSEPLTADKVLETMKEAVAAIGEKATELGATVIEFTTPLTPLRVDEQMIVKDVKRDTEVEPSSTESTLGSEHSFPSLSATEVMESVKETAAEISEKASEWGSEAKAKVLEFAAPPAPLTEEEKIKFESEPHMMTASEVIESVKETAAAISEKASEWGSEAKAKVLELATPLTAEEEQQLLIERELHPSTATQVFESVKETAHEFTEKASELGSEIRQKIHDVTAPPALVEETKVVIVHEDVEPLTITKVVESVKGAASALGEKASELGSEVKSKVNELTAPEPSTATKVFESVKETAHEFTEKASELGSGIRQKIHDVTAPPALVEETEVVVVHENVEPLTVSKVVEAVKEKAHELSDKAHELRVDAKYRIHQMTAPTISDDIVLASQALESAKETVVHAGETISETVSQWGHIAKEKIDEFVHPHDELAFEHKMEHGQAMRTEPEFADQVKLEHKLAMGGVMKTLLEESENKHVQTQMQPILEEHVFMPKIETKVKESQIGSGNEETIDHSDELQHENFQEHEQRDLKDSKFEIERKNAFIEVPKQEVKQDKFTAKTDSVKDAAQLQEPLQTTGSALLPPSQQPPATFDPFQTQNKSYKDSLTQVQDDTTSDIKDTTVFTGDSQDLGNRTKKAFDKMKGNTKDTTTIRTDDNLRTDIQEKSATDKHKSKDLFSQ